MDWFLATLRLIVTKTYQSKVDQAGIRTEYIKSRNACDPLDFIRFIRFLKCTRKLDYQTETLHGESVIFRIYTFEIRSFLTIQDRKQNKHQINKLMRVFNELHWNIIIRFLATMLLSRVYKPTKLRTTFCTY